MRITAVRLDRLRLPLDPPLRAAWDPEPRRHVDATVVRVETDAGVVGVGSGDTMAGFEAYEHLFVGRDPLRMTRHVRAIESVNFHAGRFWPLEAALWDVVGQVTGQPVSVLFGNVADRLPAYASTGEVRSPGQRVESALAARELGFRAMKIRVDAARLAEGVATVAAVRDAVGGELALMVDLNQSWRMPGDVAPALDLATVRRTVDALADLGVTWVEEPLPYADRSGLATLRAGARTRIAGGEMVASFDEALAMVTSDALDVYQMDVVLAVGMHRARTLAELAMHRNRAFTPHSWTNGIGLLANLHVAAGVGAGPWFEVPWDPPGWTPERRDFMLREPVHVDRDGMLAVPAVPGLGVVLDPGAMSRWRT